MKRGIVLSLDAVFALYIVMLAVMTFAVVSETQSQTNMDMLELSRLARDIVQVDRFSPGSSATLGLKLDSACADAKVSGAALIIKYAKVSKQAGYEGLATASKVVCP